MPRLLREKLYTPEHGFVTAKIRHINENNKCPEAAQNIEVSDLLMAYLSELGVEYVFGIPGGAIEPLYNALARSERAGGPQAIVARHETGAAFMADGYSRNSGRLGVCCATTGPGATNLITGVASAYENNVPMLVITAQTALTHFGRKAFQESGDTGINTVGMFQFCTHYNTLVSHAEQFEQKLVAALMTAMNHSGPVHLSIPIDILKSTLMITRPAYNVAALLETPCLQDEKAVEALSRELSKAKQPVFVLGGGCTEAIGVILRVAFELNARIVTTPEGKGLISPYHPLYCGVIGFAGHQSAKDVLSDPRVDAVVAVGTTFGEWSSNGWDASTLLNDRLIHVEPLENNLTRSPMARLHVRGRVLSVFETVMSRVTKNKMRELVDDTDLPRSDCAAGQLQPKTAFITERCSDPGDARRGIKPQWLMGELTKLFPSNTKYLADTGNSMAWAIHYLHPFDRRRLERRQGDRTELGRRHVSAGLFQAALEFASMGWAIGNSIGAALANPKDTVVCITGDGSALMSGQELTVALEHQLSVVFVILNDSSLGMVRHGQRLAGAEQIGCKLPSVDFSAMARAMGITSYLIEKPEDLFNLRPVQMAGNGPVLIDVRIDAEEVPPMGMRIKVLANT